MQDQNSRQYLYQILQNHMKSLIVRRGRDIIFMDFYTITYRGTIDGRKHS